MAEINRTCTFEPCGRPLLARGLCTGHYAQRRRGEDLSRLRQDISLSEKVDALIDKSGDCWEWQGFIHHSGYGVITFRGQKVIVHRFVYQADRGDIPKGMHIDHICRNRSCVRGSHLRLVTPKQNSENHSGARSDSKSGVRGVQWDKRRNRWQAVVNGRLVGRFRTLEEADAAATARRLEVFTHNELDRQRAQRMLLLVRMTSSWKRWDCE